MTTLDKAVIVSALALIALALALPAHAEPSRRGVPFAAGTPSRIALTAPELRTLIAPYAGKAGHGRGARGSNGGPYDNGNNRANFLNSGANVPMKAAKGIGASSRAALSAAAKSGFNAGRNSK